MNTFITLLTFFIIVSIATFCIMLVIVAVIRITFHYTKVLLRYITKINKNKQN